MHLCLIYVFHFYFLWLYYYIFHGFLSIIALQKTNAKEEIGKLSEVNNAKCSLIEGKLFPLFYFFELQLGKCDF